ncbi:MAG: hypothetical protein JST80_05415 [Bdellovibrionales bacterium]|nr:hypothetical protein [Bdellovibrionales bacterium]
MEIRSQASGQPLTPKSTEILTHVVSDGGIFHIQALSAAEKEIPSTGSAPIALWHLNESSASDATPIIDAMGTHNGVLNTDTGAASKSVPGQLSGAINFDGTGDSIAIPAASDLDLSSGDYTIWAWIYP